MKTLKQYLGDSVYVDWDGQMIRLTTENGYGPTNEIFMEPEVLMAFEYYLKLLREKLEKERAVENL